ncbi:hypothetical protein Taro_010522 [Colocasia esculenta]|uniref:Uncharacterized protein n=1 Tax=Colocasia esculenta TaxID=4460 RepID=A0A843TZ44_COLES|nr:hypothetical protein [Colocasia esculenta]
MQARCWPGRLEACDAGDELKLLRWRSWCCCFGDPGGGNRSSQEAMEPIKGPRGPLLRGLSDLHKERNLEIGLDL